MPVRALRIAAAVELATLVVLVANLLTAHWPAVSTMTGPVHGCGYLFVVILTFRMSTDVRTRVTALVPGVGGLLVLRRQR